MRSKLLLGACAVSLLASFAFAQTIYTDRATFDIDCTNDPVEDNYNAVGSTPAGPGGSSGDTTGVDPTQTGGTDSGWRARLPPSARSASTRGS